jgi:hypothetical protein
MALVLTANSSSVMLDSDFEPAGRHGEFGAELVLVGLDLGHRQRGRGLEAPHGQANGAAVDEGNDDEPDQGRDEKPDAEIHDRLNHGTTPPNATLARSSPMRPWQRRAGDASNATD